MSDQYTRGRDTRDASARGVAYSCPGGASDEEPCLNDAHQGDVGSEIRIALLDCKKTGIEPLDLTTQTVLKIKVRKPSGVEVTWTAIVFGDPLEGVILYIVVEGDLDEVGDYVLQVYLEITGWKGHSSTCILNVASVIAGE